MAQERAVRTILGLEPSPGGVFPSPGAMAQTSLIGDEDLEGTFPYPIHTLWHAYATGFLYNAIQRVYKTSVTFI